MSAVAVYDNRYKRLNNINLTATEIRYLDFMLSEDRLFSIDEILTGVFGDYIDETNVRLYAGYLNKKAGTKIVVNRRGFGYFIDRNQLEVKDHD